MIDEELFIKESTMIDNPGGQVDRHESGIQAAGTAHTEAQRKG